MKSIRTPGALRTTVGTFLLIGSLQLASAQQNLDASLVSALHQAGFTGRIEASLETRLGRKINRKLADLGRLLWFDNAGGLHSDNTCGGCHSPTNGFGDTQSIAIGIQNNNIVGPGRSGPRNQRRTPTVANTAFYPNLMWNGRFLSGSGDPFHNAKGFLFPLPEGTTSFPPFDPLVTHLLIAQAHIPPTELVEVAGFTGTAGTIGPAFDQFDDGLGSPVPPPDSSGFRSCVCQLLQKDLGHANPSNGTLIPPEPPVVVFLPAGTERSAQGRAVFGAA